MIKVSYTQDIEMVKTVVTEPRLWKAAHAGSEVAPENWEPETYLTWLKIELDGKIIGVLPFKRYTGIMAECHYFILPQYWGTGISSEAAKEVVKWFKINTLFRKLYTCIPENCHISANFALRVGFKVVGYIEHAIIYNNQLVGLILLMKELE